MTHEAALTDLIRDVIEQGSAKVETRLLLRWFGRRNWGRAIWQSLHQRFQSELADRRKMRAGSSTSFRPHPTSCRSSASAPKMPPRTMAGGAPSRSSSRASRCRLGAQPVKTPLYHQQSPAMACDRRLNTLCVPILLQMPRRRSRPGPATGWDTALNTLWPDHDL